MEYMLSTEDRVMPKDEFRRLLKRAVLRAMDKRNMATPSTVGYIEKLDDLNTLEQLLVSIMEGDASVLTAV